MDLGAAYPILRYPPERPAAADGERVSAMALVDPDEWSEYVAARARAIGEQPPASPRLWSWIGLALLAAIAADLFGGVPATPAPKATTEAVERSFQQTQSAEAEDWRLGDSESADDSDAPEVAPFARDQFSRPVKASSGR